MKTDNYIKQYYTVYIAEEDKTFVMSELSKNGIVIELEVVGFHFGEPGKDSFSYIGNLKAEFNY